MTKILDSALRLLTRREHAASELAVKLASKGYEEQDINAAIAECQRLGWQSDLRFAEALCRTRSRQGYGPLVIQQELQAKHIDSTLIETVLANEQANWLDYAIALWHKKYKHQPTTSFKELQKRQRFLFSHGFPVEIINQVVQLSQR